MQNEEKQMNFVIIFITNIIELGQRKLGIQIKYLGTDQMKTLSLKRHVMILPPLEIFSLALQQLDSTNCLPLF